MYPIGTIDDRTWIVYTTPDQTLASILEKAKNGGIKMSGGNPLSDCHLSWGSLIAMEGGKVSVVPYDGGANQKKGLTDGEELDHLADLVRADGTWVYYGVPAENFFIVTWMPDAEAAEAKIAALREEGDCVACCVDLAEEWNFG